MTRASLENGQLDECSNVWHRRIQNLDFIITVSVNLHELKISKQYEQNFRTGKYIKIVR